jgi:hypothetical protein
VEVVSPPVRLTVALTIAACGASLEPAAQGEPWRPLAAVVRPEVPAAGGLPDAGNPIDSFIAAGHRRQGLEPAGEAERHVLLRRVYLDLIGLPPTPAELKAFLSDDARGAYERLVERLLASPQYGERWGRHWMDIWRYSDWAGWSGGGQIRDSQPHIWRWRDWIIESLNSDKGYDRMVLEMLAADELAPTDEDALRATGYLVRNYKMLSRETWMQDVVKHTAQAFLGMTLDCARCHDHKYDAISQEDYYRVRAIFEPHNVRTDRVAGELDTKKDGLVRAYDSELEAPTHLFIRGDDRNPDKDRAISPGLPAAWGDVPFEVHPVSLPKVASYPGLRERVQAETIAAHEAKLAEARAELDAACAEKSPGEIEVIEKAFRKAELELSAARARVLADQARYADPPAADAKELALAAGAAERQVEIAAAELDLANAQVELAQAQEAPPSDNKDKLKDAESKATEASKRLAEATSKAAEPTDEYTPLSSIYPETSTGRRLALARWMVDPQNPLVARVAVNHIWQRHFGQALVETVFDFGKSGRAPSHPELLDWLAAELMQPTWRLEDGEGGPAWRTCEDAAPAWSMKHLHRLIVTSRAYRMSDAPDAGNAKIDPDNRYLWRSPARRMEAELVRDAILFVSGRLDTTMGGPELDQEQGFANCRRSIYFRHAQEKQMPFLKTFDCAAVTECYERKESVIPQQALAMMNSELTIASARELARRLGEECRADNDAEFVVAAYETVLSRTPTDEEVSVCVEFLQDDEASADSLQAKQDLVQVLLNHNDFVTIR